MKKPLALLGVSALVGLSVMVGNTPAYAGNVTTYLTDWDTSQTRSAGHLEIVDDGLHVWTDDATSNAKVAAYHKGTDGMNLNNVGTPVLNWEGSSPAPGLQLVIDIPGGTGWDGILVGESVYGDNWWLSNGSVQELKDKAPGGEKTGGGSKWYGTLAEWSTALGGAGWVSQFGFSLGSGVKGDGVVKSMTFGGDTYTFKNLKKISWVKAPWKYPKATCTDVAVVKLPTQEGVKYTKTDAVEGKVTVSAAPERGYYFKEGIKTSWEFDISKKTGEECNPTTPPTTTPPTSTPPTSTPPTATPTTGAPTTPAPVDPEVPVGGRPTTSQTPVSGGLPLTGDKGPLKALVIGGGAIAIGAIILAGLAASRRRNAGEIAG